LGGKSFFATGEPSTLRYSGLIAGILRKELVQSTDRLSERMLRHIIALPLLLLSLLAADASVFACGVVPTQDCCPNGPISPCALEQAKAAEANRLDFCCVAGSTITTTTAMAIPSNENGKHWDGVAPPALLVALTTLTTAYVQSLLVDDFRFVSQPLSDSTLYLSTGRLRL
jgi:hypothetical protein